MVFSIMLKNKTKNEVDLGVEKTKSKNISGKEDKNKADLGVEETKTKQISGQRRPKQGRSQGREDQNSTDLDLKVDPEADLRVEKTETKRIPLKFAS